MAFPLFLLLLLSTAGTIQPSSLDPKQLTALQSMGIPTSTDPCSPTRNSTTTCDSSSPFRHLTSLSLSRCSPDLHISPTAIRSMSTLVSLSFADCPDLTQPKRPLPSSLRPFTCTRSFRRLSGVWLSRLRGLTRLNLTGVPVSASAPFVFLSQMPHLLSATASGSDLPGGIPRHWRCLNLTLLDLSNNSLSGPIPPSLTDVIYLRNLSLSRIRLSGPIPTAMSALPDLTHLDLASNRLNGSVHAFLAEIEGLVYLDLQNNDFQGVVPFNGSFIKRLQVFRIGGNSNLCYNRSLVSPKAKLGIAACARYGMPVSPPPDRPGKSSDYGDDGDGEDDGDDGGGGGEGGGMEVGAGGIMGLVFLCLGWQLGWLVSFSLLFLLFVYPKFVGEIYEKVLVCCCCGSSIERLKREEDGLVIFLLLYGGFTIHSAKHYIVFVCVDLAVKLHQLNSWHKV